MLLSPSLWYFEVLICYQRRFAIVVCDLILWLLYCVIFSVASDAAPAAADVYVVTMHQQNNRWQINGFLCSFNDTLLWVCLAQPSFFSNSTFSFSSYRLICWSICPFKPHCGWWVFDALTFITQPKLESLRQISLKILHTSLSTFRQFPLDCGNKTFKNTCDQ